MKDLKSLPKSHLLKVMEQMAKDLAELKLENKKLEYRIAKPKRATVKRWVGKILGKNL